MLDTGVRRTQGYPYRMPPRPLSACFTQGEANLSLPHLSLNLLPAHLEPLTPSPSRSLGPGKGDDSPAGPIQAQFPASDIASSQGNQQRGD